MSILLFTAHLSIPWWRQPHPPRRRRWGCTGRCTGRSSIPWGCWYNTERPSPVRIIAISVQYLIQNPSDLENDLFDLWSITSIMYVCSQSSTVFYRITSCITSDGQPVKGLVRKVVEVGALGIAFLGHGFLRANRAKLWRKNLWSNSRHQRQPRGDGPWGGAFSLTNILSSDVLLRGATELVQVHLASGKGKAMREANWTQKMAQLGDRYIYIYCIYHYIYITIYIYTTVI